jgi:4-hydroxy-tetrahydrodipicolinate synthase
VRPRFLAAISTPFDASEAPDLGAFAAHLAWLREQRLDGVFVAGTTGEGVLLEDDEVAALVEAAVAAGDGLQIVAQVGRPSTRATVRLARRAIELGADAVAAYVPWFYPATDADARGHFLALLEAAEDTPAFLYNIPRRTVNDLSPALLADLSAAGYAGMKDSTGDFARHREYLDALAGRHFELYTGSEPLVLESVRAGAAGAVTGLAGARPDLFAALADALEAGDGDAAQRAQDAIAAGRAEINDEGSVVAAVKRRVAAAIEGYPPAPRPPFA